MAGPDIATRAWQALRRRQLSIELLVTIAASGAMLSGIADPVRHGASTAR